ncbi:MAG: hypothetical protein EOO09_03255 [Chitinophagaceae bacterium]|nr:MAG: hypothetical protein EOO09_03255 [Chitinophagaceae bacterium]
MSNPSYSHGQSKAPDKNQRDDLPVITTIKKKKAEYCKTIKVKLGDLRKSEEDQHGLSIIYEHWKCRFTRTEKNYQMYRNLKLVVGFELTKTSEKITESITGFEKDNTTLATALTDLVKLLKTAKGKFSELRDSANKLEACSNDRCNRTQMMLLTGEKYDDCDDKKEPCKRPPDCENAKELLEYLIKHPAQLSKQVDIVLNSAADTVGIQTFSNISALAKDFLPGVTKGAKDFDDFLTERTTAGATDLGTAYISMSSAIKDLVSADYLLYNDRVNLDVANSVKDFLCNPDCDCVCEGDGKLEKCKCDICDICHEVTTIYYRDPDNNDKKAD